MCPQGVFALELIQKRVCVACEHTENIGVARFETRFLGDPDRINAQRVAFGMKPDGNLE